MADSTQSEAPEADPTAGRDDTRDTAAVVRTAERRGKGKDHHHEGGLGPVNTPAGAHKHSGFEEEHVHLVPPLPPDKIVIHPAPVADDARDVEVPNITVTVDADCKVVFEHQLITLSRGQKVSGPLAQHLVDHGADVTPFSKD